MKRTRRSVLNQLLVISLGLCAGEAAATTVIMPSDDDLIIGARAIVKGEVLSMLSAHDDRVGMICTYVRIRVDETLKGTIGTGEIVLKQPGGTDGNRGLLFYGAPTFTRGERVLLYLDTWPDGSLRVHQMFLGKFSIINDPRSGESVAIRGGGDNVEFIGTANNKVTDRMEATSYVRMVRERLSVNAARAATFEATYYTGWPVLARPAEYERTAGRVRPQFTFYIPDRPARWFDFDDGATVVFRYKPDGAPTSQVKEDLQAAAAAWSVRGSTVKLAIGDTLTGCTFPGDTASVVFDNCTGFFPPSQCGLGMVVGAGGIAFDSTQTKAIGGITYARGLGALVEINPFAVCLLSNSCNLREVLTHELGHSIGLGHSWEPSFGGIPTAVQREATMFHLASFDSRCAGLRADDVNGVRAIYPDPRGIPPLITKLKYKPGGRKLFVTGEDFAPGTVVVIAGEQRVPKSNTGTSMTVKKLTLAPGEYEARVMLPNGVMSDPVLLTVR